MTQSLTPAAERPRPAIRAPGGAPSPLPRPDPVGARLFAALVGAATAAVAIFLAVQLEAWPPHEDETLALFVGREPLGGLFHTVLGDRGGAPLHFFFAWIVAHTGGGLGGLRLVSALFAVGSVPIIAILCARLAGRAPALVATAIVATSWVLLFHGVYGRMYSIFLATSALSYLAFLHALDRRTPRAWTLWGIAVLLTIAAHPYGAIVLASQGLYVLLARRLRDAIVPLAAVGVLGIPFWRTDLVLAGRFDVGVGGGGAKLSGPLSVLRYFEMVAGDFVAGYGPLLAVVGALGLFGLWRLARTRPRSALLAAVVFATPMIVLVLARFGSSTSPETRHLIFELPFFALVVGVGLVRVARMAGPLAPALIVVAVGALAPAEIAWGWHKTPELYTGEPAARIAARHAASAWLARTGRADDVFFGYDPLFLGAWERNARTVSRVVVPRADPRLALRTLERSTPLGRGVFVLDASDNNNFAPALRIQRLSPRPAGAFETRAFGPFLVIRTRAATVTPRRFLTAAARAEQVGKWLDIGDADVNADTVLRAQRRLDAR